MSAADGDPPTTNKTSRADAPKGPVQPLPGWPVRPRPGAANAPTMTAPTPPEAARRGATPIPPAAGAVAPPGIPSERELRGTVEELAQRVGIGRDPDASAEIPPPDAVPAQRPAGAKDPYIGTTFDHRYKIEELLGEGGMGYVYRARHKVIDKKVAVKVLRAELARDREILDRFVQEARAASSIGNAHIVDISDFGDLPDGSTYFVMEYLEGKSLAQLVEARNQLTTARICHIGIQIAEALAAAHARDIVHRDLKPDNAFLITRGTDTDFVKILDFGIAKVTKNATTKLTRAGAVFGTPHYMSPEQAAGAPIDRRTDIYSLGVILYEMTAGQLPFNADNFMGILTQHMYKAPVPIRALVPTPDCPPGLEAIILKALTKKPEGRYQTMEELAADLERVKRDEVPLAVSELMARSGGFNVPHDYFKKPAMMVPAMPPSRGRPTGMVVAAAIGIPVVVAGAIFAFHAMTTQASPKKTDDMAAVSAPPPTATAAPAAPPEPMKAIVAVAATPDTAVAYRDGSPIKLPASIEVEEGKTVRLELKADGYEPQWLDLDGKDASKLVKLVPRSGRATPGSGAPRGGGRTTSKHSDLVNPWEH